MRTEPSHRVFTEDGGSIGRASTNTWVLTHHKVSGRHAEISFRDGVFYITDLSRNGVSVNSPDNRLVREQPYALQAGDTIFIGPYTIEASIETGPAPSAFEPLDDPFRGEDLFAPLRGPQPARIRPVPPPGGGDEVDPLELLAAGSGPAAARAPTSPGPAADDWLGEHYYPMGADRDPIGPPPDEAAPVPVAPLPETVEPGSGGPGSGETVKCSIFAAEAVVPGEPFLIEVFAHRPIDDERVKRMAGLSSKDASVRAAKLLDQDIAQGTVLTFSLTLAGAVIDEPAQTLVWRGVPDMAQFGVQFPVGQPAGPCLGMVMVSEGSVPVGHLKFVLRVLGAADRSRHQLPAPPADYRWTRYRRAFISYAWPDRSEVLKRVQMLERVAIEFFHDLLSLEPGERWERALYRHIDQSDVFFLFWSTAAKQSEWVIREVRYALERRGGDEHAPPEIIPIIIEGPPPVAPPPELSDLHFNDRFMYFIAGSSSPAAT